MWNLILYVLAVVAGVLLFASYEPTKPSKSSNAPRGRTKKQKPKSSLSENIRVSKQTTKTEKSCYNSFEELAEECLKAKISRVNLVFGVDLTASNEWQGRKSFGKKCLHSTSTTKLYNPYQKVLWTLGQVLTPLTEDLLGYGFGDSVTRDQEVVSFKKDGSPCEDSQDVLDRYNDVLKRVKLGGPTSFAPVIAKAIELVKQTHKYHILVIIADGQVTEEGPTIDAIVEASKHPISIIVVGVGDGPWDIMEEFDHRLPKRKFDNFHFVNYHKAIHKAKNPDAAFVLQALMEIPDQYRCLRSLGYITGKDSAALQTNRGQRTLGSYSLKAGKRSFLRRNGARRTSLTSDKSSSPNSPRQSVYSDEGCIPEYGLPSRSTAV